MGLFDKNKQKALKKRVEEEEEEEEVVETKKPLGKKKPAVVEEEEEEEEVVETKKTLGKKKPAVVEEEEEEEDETPPPKKKGAAPAKAIAKVAKKAAPVKKASAVSGSTKDLEDGVWEACNELKQFQDNPLTKVQVSLIIKEIAAQIRQITCNMGRLQWNEIGIWNKKERKAYEGRNPQTGEAVPVDAMVVVSYKPSKLFKQFIKETPKKKKK
jgi:DNA-binding protein HU-beta